MRQFNAGLQGLAQVKNGVSARKSISLRTGGRSIAVLTGEASSRNWSESGEAQAGFSGEVSAAIRRSSRASSSAVSLSNDGS